MNIRPATQADIAFIRDCAEQAYAPYVERIGRKPAPMVDDFPAIVAQRDLRMLGDVGVDGGLAGFIVFYPHLGYRETGRRQEDGFAASIFATRCNPASARQRHDATGSVRYLEIRLAIANISVIC